VITKAETACELSGHPVQDHFVDVNKMVDITTSGFTKDALDYVSRIEMKIVLIDGETLAQMMIEHNVGVSTVSQFTLKRIDSDYFSEE
jgi:restriction system protein